MLRKITHFTVVLSTVSLAAAAACSSDDSGGKAGGDAGVGSGGESASSGGAGSGGRAGGSGGTAMGSGGASTGDAGECATGCSCGSGETCDYTCAASCTVECLGGTCAAACPAGGCTLDADNGGEATFTCAGGSCVTDCDGESSCNVDCAGGGCEVACDGNSTCNVTCSESGTPCTVTCIAGSRATCEGNCELQGCPEGDAAACVPMPRNPPYNPAISPTDFSTTIDNPLFPLPVGATWTFNAPGEVITVTVTDQTKVVMGVTCVVVRDTVTTLGAEGALIEDTFDWYAQHSDGSVWYFGEATTEYVDGQPDNTHGSWEGGVDGALPGVVMPATPAVGDAYLQEYYVCEAEDEAEVIAVNESVTVPQGSYTGCVRTRDFTRLDLTANEYKTYCPGVGVVLVSDVASGTRMDELVSVAMP